MFGIIKERLIGLLTSIVNASNDLICVSLSNQKYEIQPTFINFHSNEYSQELYYYPFADKLDGCVGSCYILNDLPNKVCNPNKTEDLNKHVFNMSTRTKEQKILTKYMSCECKRRFDEKNIIQINDGTAINGNVSVKNVCI